MDKLDQLPTCSMNMDANDVIELGSSDDEQDVLKDIEQPHWNYDTDGTDQLGSSSAIAQFTSPKKDSPKPKLPFSLVDETHELVDPNPDIHDLFMIYDQQFFWGTLSARACTVEWSKTMTTCAGICRFAVGTGLCCIRLSEPLLKLRRRKDLVETLLHEMIHGYLFVTGGIQDRDGHGPDFQSHMHRINAMAGTSITVYHSFHAEVAHYKVHWWRCTGPCKERAPYHGWVKRAMNRAPGPNDLWWKEHQANCNGTFVKVKEPEKKEKKTKKQDGTQPASSLPTTPKTEAGKKRGSSSSEINIADPKQPKIESFFPGKGYVLGGKSSSSLETGREPAKIKQLAVSPEPEIVVAEDERSDGPAVAKRKKRTKEEIERDRLEKEVNKIRRQMQSAKNTKCEQYLYCYFSSKIFQLNDDLQGELRKRFEERGISDQFVVDGPSSKIMMVLWRKKRLDAYLEEGKVHSSETMELQSHFCSVLGGDTFTALAKTRGDAFMEFLREQLQVVKRVAPDTRLTLVVLGKHSVRESNLASLIFEAFERYRIQFRFVPNVVDFSFLVVQYHRALAKLEKKVEKHMEAEQAGTSGTHVVAEKGISDGPGMVEDWWGRMLDHMHRMGEEQKRAIIRAHPNPIRLMDHLVGSADSAGDSMFALSDIQQEGGRRLGPVLAQKMYKMLTSSDGTEIIDNGN